MPSILPSRHAGRTKAANVSLWAAQSLLAVVFLFAGVVKLAMPLAPVAQQTGLPVAFLRGVAVAELLGALGLILPGVLRIRPALTPLAAACLAGVMAGAAVVTALTQGIAAALPPVIVGIVLTAIVWGRQPWARGQGPSRRGVPSPGKAPAVATREAA